jgi:hypothetical protein
MKKCHIEKVTSFSSFKKNEVITAMRYFVIARNEAILLNFHSILLGKIAHVSYFKGVHEPFGVASQSLAMTERSRLSLLFQGERQENEVYN